MYLTWYFSTILALGFSLALSQHVQYQPVHQEPLGAINRDVSNLFGHQSQLLGGATSTSDEFHVQGLERQGDRGLTSRNEPATANNRYGSPKANSPQTGKVSSSSSDPFSACKNPLLQRLSTSSPHKQSKRAPDVTNVGMWEDKFESFTHGPNRKIGVTVYPGNPGMGAFIVALIAPKGAVVANIPSVTSDDQIRTHMESFQRRYHANKADLQGATASIVYTSTGELSTAVNSSLTNIGGFLNHEMRTKIDTKMPWLFSSIYRPPVLIIVDGTLDQPVLYVNGRKVPRPPQTGLPQTATSSSHQHSKRNLPLTYVLPSTYAHERPPPSTNVHEGPPFTNVNAGQVEFESSAHGPNKMIAVIPFHPLDFAVALMTEEGAVLAHIPPDSDDSHTQAQIQRIQDLTDEHHDALRDSDVFLVHPVRDGHAVQSTQLHDITGHLNQILHVSPTSVIRMIPYDVSRGEGFVVIDLREGGDDPPPSLSVQHHLFSRRALGSSYSSQTLRPQDGANGYQNGMIGHHYSKRMPIPMTYVAVGEAKFEPFSKGHNRLIGVNPLPQGNFVVAVISDVPPNGAVVVHIAPPPNTWDDLPTWNKMELFHQEVNRHFHDVSQMDGISALVISPVWDRQPKLNGHTVIPQELIAARQLATIMEYLEKEMRVPFIDKKGYDASNSDVNMGIDGSRVPPREWVTHEVALPVSSTRPQAPDTRNGGHGQSDHWRLKREPLPLDNVASGDINFETFQHGDNLNVGVDPLPLTNVASGDVKFESFLDGDNLNIGVDPLPCGHIVVAVVSHCRERGVVMAHIPPPNSRQQRMGTIDQMHALVKKVEKHFNHFEHQCKLKDSVTTAIVVFPEWSKLPVPHGHAKTNEESVTAAQLDDIMNLLPKIMDVNQKTLDEIRYDASSHAPSKVTIRGKPNPATKEVGNRIELPGSGTPEEQNGVNIPWPGMNRPTNHRRLKREPGMTEVAVREIKFESFTDGLHRKIGVDPLPCGSYVVAMLSPGGAVVVHIPPISPTIPESEAETATTTLMQRFHDRASAESEDMHERSIIIVHPVTEEHPPTSGHSVTNGHSDPNSHPPTNAAHSPSQLPLIKKFLLEKMEGVPIAAIKGYDASDNLPSFVVIDGTEGTHPEIKVGNDIAESSTGSWSLSEDLSSSSSSSSSSSLSSLGEEEE